ncbi:hypothetical protein PHYSODRAFT_503333, partial [Phytophthora sojae]
TAARWRLFGHILRRPEIPAYTQMAAYFDSSSNGAWRGRPHTILPTRAIIAALPAKKDPTYADTTLCRRLAKLSLAKT